MMRVLPVVAVALALFTIASADEDKKTKNGKLFRCVACCEHQAARDEMMKCRHLRPENCKKVVNECKKELVPGTNMEEYWKTLCKNDDDITGQLYDCIENQKCEENLTEEDQKKVDDYYACTEKVNKGYCKI